MTSYTSSYIPEILLCGCEQTLGASVSIFYKKKKKKERKKGTVHKKVEMQYIIFWFVSGFLLLKIKLDQNWKVIMIPVFDYFVQCWCVSADQLILHLSFDTQEREIWILSKPVRGLVSQFKVRGMLGQTIKTENALGQ